jgi:hypothetical protein
MIAGNRAPENHPVVVDVAAHQRQGGVSRIDQRLDDAVSKISAAAMLLGRRGEIDTGAPLR